MKRKLLAFEFVKIGKKKTTWAAIAVTALAVIGLYILNYSAAKTADQVNLNMLDRVIQGFDTYAKEAEANPPSAKDDEGEPDSASFQKLKRKYENQKSAYLNGSWKKYYQESVRTLTEYTNGLSIKGFEDENINDFTLRATLDERLWIQRHGIEAFTASTIYIPYLPTIYDTFKGSTLEKWKKDVKRYGITGFSFLYQLMQTYYLQIVILLGCFIFGNGISSEMADKKKGMNFYYALPARRRDIYLAKYISGLASTAVFAGIMIILVLVCSLFTKGIGSLQLPVLIYEGSKPNPFGSEFNSLKPSEDQFHFISFQDYLWKALLLAFLLMIVFYTLYFFLSLIVKNSALTLVVLGLAVYTGMNYFPLAYNPFTYADIHKVLNGEAAALAFNPDIRFENGIMVLLLFLCLTGFAAFLAGAAAKWKVKRSGAASDRPAHIQSQGR